MNYATLSSTIRGFTDLHAWKEGHKLVLMIYKVARTFPREERFELATQICSAAASITSNIAEGFSRGSYKEKLYFYGIALGSTTEIQNQLYIAKDVGHISTESFTSLYKQSITVHKLINGLIKKSKAIIHDS
jgi:four helix bundle protein